MKPRTLLVVASGAEILTDAYREYSKDREFYEKLYASLSYEDRIDYGNIAHEEAQARQKLLYDRGRQEQIIESLEEDEDTGISILTTQVQLDTNEFPTIFVEKTLYITHEDECFVEYRSGMLEPEAFYDTPSLLREMYYFTPDENDWTDQANFVWMHDGLETITHTALSMSEVNG